MSDTTLTSTRSPLSPDVEDRFRGLVRQLPSNAIAKELVDVFFSEANWYFGVLERYYFDKLHNSWYAVGDAMPPKGEFGSILRDLQYFPALLFQVLAVALQYLPPIQRAPESFIWKILQLVTGSLRSTAVLAWILWLC